MCERQSPAWNSVAFSWPDRPLYAIEDLPIEKQRMTAGVGLAAPLESSRHRTGYANLEILLRLIFLPISTSRIFRSEEMVCRPLA